MTGTPLDIGLMPRRRLPVVKAAEAAECGLACLAMVANYHGHDVDLIGLRQRHALSLTGLSLPGMAALARAMHLASRPLKVEISALRQVRTPAVLHWDGNHFVVLREIRRGRAIIHDPAVGARSLSLAEVAERFTGYVLELWPTADFTPIEARRPLKLTRLWSRATGLWSSAGRILALSILLQLVVLTGPLQLQLALDQAITRADGHLLGLLAVSFGLLAVLYFALEVLRNWSVQVVGALFSFQVVGNVFRHLLKLPVSFFEKRHVGDLLSRIQSANAIQDLFTRGVATGVIDGVMVMIAAAIMWAYSPTLTLVVLGSVLIAAGLMAISFRILREGMDRQLRAAANERSHIMESIRAISVIRLMGREAEREETWRDLFAVALNGNLSVGRVRQLLTAAQTLVSALATVAIIYLGGRLVMLGEGFSLGMLVAFVAYKQVFGERTTSLLSQILELRFIGLHLERLGDIVATPALAEDPPSWAGAGGAGLELCGVRFRYGATDPEVLKDVDLKIAPGDYVAITGPSGGGKTTLLKLLLGLHEPTSGAVMLSGRPATPGAWRAWRSRVGVVSQDDMLLAGTIADNIGFFDPRLDLERVVEAARLARVHDDVARLPMQYRSLVGDMGSVLSGGQRQRILLARALYRRPEYLFLDEGTANLDPETEESIADLIAGLQCTRIVVAHRPALVRRASRVLRVSDGQVAALAEPQNRVAAE